MNISYRNLRAIKEGYDPDAVLTVGGECFLDEAFATTAAIQSRAIRHGDTMREVKHHMSAGTKLAKTGETDDAIAEYNSAIQLLKQLRKEAEQIEDDILEQVYNENLITALASIIASTAVTAIGLMSDVKRITASVKALTKARSFKAIGGAIKGIGSSISATPSWLTIGGLTIVILSFIYGTKQKLDFDRALYGNIHIRNGEVLKDKTTVKYVEGFHVASTTRDETLARIDRLIESCEDCQNILRSTK